MEEEQEDVTHALVLALRCTTRECKFDVWLCSAFWNRVFAYHYGEKPCDDEDPRWDKIIHGTSTLAKEIIAKHDQYRYKTAP